MQSQIVIVNGKTRRAKTKFGNEYITLFVDVVVSEADHFAKKCSLLGKTRSDILRDLIQGFNHSFGWQDEGIKDAGSLYERRAKFHIKDAIKKVSRELFPWILNEN